MIDLIRQADPAASVDLVVQRNREELYLRNSAGARARHKSAALVVDLWVERHRPDDVLVVSDSFKAARLNAGHRDFAARVAQRLTWADKPASVRPGRMPVILSPTAVATLLRPLVIEFSGVRVRAKGSPLANKLGQQLFDPRFTLVDDGMAAGQAGAAVDHEGVPTQRTELVREGVVTGFYYDLQTAAQSGVRSTGNGRRDLLAPPCPQPGNLSLEPGTQSLEALLQQASDGLLVDLLLGDNPTSALRGTFSRTVVLGYKIEHGRIAGYVKGVALAGNLYEMLRDVRAVGDTGYWSVNMCVPYVLIGGMNVST